MPWENTFYIGTDLDPVYGDFAPLEEWLLNKDIPVNPECVFSQFSAVYDTGNGGRAGVGFPRAAWSWQHRQSEHVEVFQTLCPGLSAQVYIRTQTNTVENGSLIWRTYLCQMLMPPEDIDFNTNQAMGFTIEFRKLVIQTELYP